MDKNIPERRQVNLRYDTWKKLMRLKVDLDLKELTDVIEYLLKQVKGGK
jgi:hypothetical protein